jgi:hypothetical protein
MSSVNNAVLKLNRFFYFFFVFLVLEDFLATPPELDFDFVAADFLEFLPFFIFSGWLPPPPEGAAEPPPPPPVAGTTAAGVTIKACVTLVASL